MYMYMYIYIYTYIHVYCHQDAWSCSLALMLCKHFPSPTLEKDSEIFSHGPWLRFDSGV